MADGVGGRAGQAQHKTSPQGESESEFVHSSDLPGLIRGLVEATNSPVRVDP